MRVGTPRQMMVSRLCARLFACIFPSLLLSCLLLAGCSGPAISTQSRTPFLDSRDLINMTNKMAVAITTDPVIATLTDREPMVIVLTPLKNETNEIITRGQGDAFLHRLRVLLVAHQSLRNRFVFIINPTSYQRLAQQGISTADLGGAQGPLKPTYALQATFYADTKVAAEYRSDYYLCTFFLTDISTGRILWEGSYETKKAVHSGFLY